MLNWKKSLVLFASIFVFLLILTGIIMEFFDFYEAIGSSMFPTIREGDTLIVKKSNTVWERGDVIVFYNSEVDMYYMKRVIGLSKERVEGKSGKILIDGKSDPHLNDSPIEDFDSVVVPKDHLFVLGDNTDESEDSRSFGPIPEQSIEGKIVFILQPLKRVGLVQ
ncbi:signal peptidase I [Kroppenstedtia pulmonis]|uniref:Signal peptidase I n=1 Tax=Kroppenstedtia pulmonis TaxID=1380685 RepID=A0A7D4B0H8_9BACL|nr:signal peptidase I [Kroppenstedtia pulmonis]QKG83106.1 signal peptidase I [Kroppenstedtia pulmonis]